jgi:hypothetical protein
MAAKDFYHEHVKTALTKDGWTITADPYLVEWLGKKLQIDLGAERLIAAEKGTEKIAVEVKSFIGPSKIENLEDALGQFVLYRFSLKRAAPERLLYLAIHESAYADIFLHPDGEALLREEQLRLVVFSIDRKEIVKWIS